MDRLALDLSRAQFAVTTIFHMIWPLLTIGLSLMMVVMEVLWLRTRDPDWYRHLRFWSRLFVLIFGIGVASGIPLELEFGTNWSRFSAASGALFGNILAFEGAMAFALEAAFLAIMLFGWDRVSRGMHLFSTIIVAFAASLSAFWILSANSWMQTPAGVFWDGSKVAISDYLKAVFNPAFPVSFAHMEIACIETTLFFVGGICAWSLAKGKNPGFFLKAFKVALVMGIIAAPLQIFLGDASGLGVAANQPAKAAAMEANWQRNPPGTGAPWAIVAWPDKARQDNRFSIAIPNGLSLLETRTPHGQVAGLRDFLPEDQPPVALPFYAFRLMVLLGFVMLALVVWALVLWARGALRPENAPRHRAFWRWWFIALPFGFIATESGWIVREMGRQPWIIYGLLRTSEGVSPIGAGSAAASLGIFSAVYVTLLVLFIVFTRRILRKGPDFESPVPALPATPGAGNAAESGSPERR